MEGVGHVPLTLCVCVCTCAFSWERHLFSFILKGTFDAPESLRTTALGTIFEFYAT